MAPTLRPTSAPSDPVPTRTPHIDLLVAGALCAIALQWLDEPPRPSALATGEAATRICEAVSSEGRRLGVCTDDDLWYAPSDVRREAGALPCRWRLSDADLDALGVGAQAHTEVAWLLASEPGITPDDLDTVAGVGPQAARRILGATQTRCARGLLPARQPPR